MAHNYDEQNSQWICKVIEK